MSSDQPYNATITDWTELAHGLAVFRVRPDEGAAPAFEPGQYATLGLPRECPPLGPGDDFPAGDPRWKKLIRRDYSIASSAQERSYIEFYLVNTGGSLTRRLWHAGSGGRVWLDTRVRGEFTLRGVPADRNLVMVATGSGLAPYISMLKTYRGTGRWRRFVIFHGVRVQTDLAYVDELERMCAADPTIQFHPTCSREPEGSTWKGLRGRVTRLLDGATFKRITGFAPDPQNSHVFLCGNPAMVDEVEGSLLAGGFVPHTRKQIGNIHLERYW